MNHQAPLPTRKSIPTSRAPFWKTLGRWKTLRRSLWIGCWALLALGVGLPTLGPAADLPKAPTPLKLVSDPWPPFTGEQGAARVAIDLVQTALQRVGHPASSTILGSGFAEVIERIREGEFDGSAALWVTPEREALLNFSKPYLENRLVLVGREGSPVDAKSVAELVGKRVAIVAAYAYGGVLDAVVGPELVSGASDLANIRKLLDGEVDYVLADELLVYDLFHTQATEAEKALEVGRFPLVSRGLHFALRKDVAGSQEIIERFDKEIRAMIADGAYHRALAVDWIWADIDGDGVAELVLGGTQAGLKAPEDAYDVLLADRGVPGDEEDKKESHYVVEGVVYDDWEGVPDRYKVDIDRTREPIDPTITLFRF